MEVKLKYHTKWSHRDWRMTDEQIAEESGFPVHLVTANRPIYSIAPIDSAAFWRNTDWYRSLRKIATIHDLPLELVKQKREEYRPKLALLAYDLYTDRELHVFTGYSLEVLHRWRLRFTRVSLASKPFVNRRINWELPLEELHKVTGKAKNTLKSKRVSKRARRPKPEHIDWTKPDLELSAITGWSTGWLRKNRPYKAAHRSHFKHPPEDLDTSLKLKDISAFYGVSVNTAARWKKEVMKK